jgi:hypothetical protein
MVGNLKPYFSDPAKQNSNYYLQEVKSLVLNFGKRNNKENNNNKKKKNVQIELCLTPLMICEASNIGCAIGK